MTAQLRYEERELMKNIPMENFELNELTYLKNN